MPLPGRCQRAVQDHLIPLCIRISFPENLTDSFRSHGVGTGGASSDTVQIPQGTHSALFSFFLLLLCSVKSTLFSFSRQKIIHGNSKELRKPGQQSDFRVTAPDLPSADCFVTDGQLLRQLSLRHMMFLPQCGNSCSQLLRLHTVISRPLPFFFRSASCF